MMLENTPKVNVPKIIESVFMNKIRSKIGCEKIRHFIFLVFTVTVHYVNVSVFIKFSQKTSVFTLIIISCP